MSDYEELQALRRLAELEAKAGGMSLAGNMSGGAGANVPEMGFAENMSKGLDIGAKQIGQAFRQSGAHALQNNLYAADMNFGGIADGSSDDYGAYQKNLQNEIRQTRNDPVLKTGGGKVGQLIAKAAPAVAATFLPGAAGLTGSALIGMGTGAMEPQLDGESKAGSVLAGGAGGVGGYYLGRGIGAAGNYLADKASKAAAYLSPRVETVNAAREAGYVFPPSMINPGFIKNRLEGLAGKAATAQDAALRNQQTTNQLVAKSLGLPPGVPLSTGVLDDLTRTAQAPYGAASSVSSAAKGAVDKWKAANADAKAWFKAYNRDMHPDTLSKAKGFRDAANAAMDEINQLVTGAGRADLVPALKSARVELGKIGTAERALRASDGNIDAGVLGRLFEKRSPLAPEMETVGRMASAFPSITREGSKVPTPGVGALQWTLPYLGMSALGAGGGYAYGGDGTSAGIGALLPLAAPPAARAMLLSKPYQAIFAKQAVPTGSAILNMLGSPASQQLLPALGAAGLLTYSP